MRSVALVVVAPLCAIVLAGGQFAEPRELALTSRASRAELPPSTPAVAAPVAVVESDVAGPAAATAAATSNGSGQPNDPRSRKVKPSDPGTAPWQKVPRDLVAKECGLDPALLEAAEPELGKTPYAVVRYGKMCWSGGGDVNAPYHVASETKSFGAALTGLVLSRTEVDETTNVHDWMGPTDINPLPVLSPDATIFGLLTMTQNNVGGYGMRVPWVYDSAGLYGLNDLPTLLKNVVKANPAAFPGSSTLADVASNDLFQPLGMTNTTWPGDLFSHTLNSSVYDMARFGLLLLRQGRWDGRQVISEGYVYRMTHPEIEDVNTGYGYLTYVNNDKGSALTFDGKADRKCSPFASWPSYPHPPMYDAPDSNGGAPYANKYDIGVFWADGAGGQYTIVHRGLDLVLVVKDDDKAKGGDTEGESQVQRIWRLVRPALVAMDPVYKGNEAAFCDAYLHGQYAPDLLSPWTAESGSVPA